MKSIKLITLLLSFLLAPAAVFAATPAITNLSVSGFDATDATLQWSIPSATLDAGGNYEIYYSSSPITASNLSSAIPLNLAASSVNSVNATSRSYKVRNLNSGSRFYFAIELKPSSDTWSPISNVISQQLTQDSTNTNTGSTGGSGLNLGGTTSSTNTATVTSATAGMNGTTNAAASGNTGTAASANDPHKGAADNYSGLVHCSGVVVNSGEVECNFSTLISSFSYLINWAFGLTIPIAVALIVWGGLLYVTGVEANIKKAKGIFGNTAKGFIIMLVAFTIVHTLVNWIGNTATTSSTTNPNPLPVSSTESLLQVQK